jgi:cyanophycin synthetase
MSIPYLIDSRRLTGRTILLDGPGAVIETQPPPEIRTHLGARWRREVRRFSVALGWGEVTRVTRWFEPTLHCALAAPIDQLLLATYVAEWAWELALSGLMEHDVPRRSRIRTRLLRRRDAAADPALVAFHERALAEGAQLLIGDGDLSVGEGRHAQTFAYGEVPDADSIDWRAARHRIPIALITGTNGKTTSTRLLARIASTAGRITGHCCTDSVEVGGEVLDRDDYSGPGGARKVLRHPQTEFAVLEVARGGLLRRGLTVAVADVALVTNIADDHLNDMGIHTLKQLAEVKFLVARALKPHGVLVTNAENEWCRDQARRSDREVAWFAVDPPHPSVLRGIKLQRGLATVRHGRLVYEQAHRQIDLIGIHEIALPGGAGARHNIANALAAAAAAIQLKLPLDAIRSTLRSFGRSVDDNPGRANLYALASGASVLADFGHNPESLSAIFAAARSLPYRRLLICIGQAGDRADEAIRSLGRLAAEQNPDRLIVKDMPKYRRGRELGAIPQLLREGAAQRHLPDERIVQCETDSAALDLTLEWLQPGDLAVLFVHSEVEAVFGRLRKNLGSPS